jgi:signal transduction histidine kinase
MNLPVIAMAMAAGISIDAAFAHGLIGVRRRPPDAVRIAFALQALAVAAGALAIIALYSGDSPSTHFEVMKWVLFPAELTWWVATIWLVAFYTGVRPLRWLLALSAGFCALIALNLALPYGVMHRVIGRIATFHLVGANANVMVAPTPHPIYHVVSALTLAAFATMFYAAWRVHRRREPGKAWIVTAFLLVFLFIGVLDTLQNYGILADLYYTQLSFVILVLGVNIGLRQESLRQEDGLLADRDHLEAVVDERVHDLDAANALLALESQERLATAEALRRRVAELDSLQRISRILADRNDLAAALDQAALEIAALMTADYAYIELADDPPATRESTSHLLAVPLVAKGVILGALTISRRRGAQFSDEERRLAETVADDVAAAVENERLHERHTRQAAEEERQRLARDLHDAVTQTLYSATLIAEALPTVWQREPSAGLSNLVRLQRLVRAALAEMRTMLFELRPAALEATPLAALLDQLGNALAGQIKGPVTIRTADDIPLSSETKLVFYRVTQEAFNNIAKHARATEVEVQCLADSDGAVSLLVRDDGRGFDPGAVGPERMGLRIMRERLEGVGASLEIDSKPGSGTTITAVWPGWAQSLAAAEEEHDRATTH